MLCHLCVGSHTDTVKMTTFIPLIILLLAMPMGLEASNPGCSLENGESGFHWSSPDFGIAASYPNNFDCSVGAGTEEPQQTLYTFNSFDLQGMKTVNNKMVCVDSVNIGIPYSRNLTYCGTQTGSLRVPNFRFRNTFLSDKRLNNKGFNITITASKTNCHKVIDLGLSDQVSGVITSPSYPNKYPKYAQCEWWIKAPVGKRIQLKIQNLQIQNTKNCLGAYVVVDRAGTRSYASDTSSLLCGSVQGKILKSVAEELNVVFDGGNARATGMKAAYQVI